MSSAEQWALLTDENKADGVRRDRGPSRGRGGASGSGAGRGRGEAASRDRRKETGDRLAVLMAPLQLRSVAIFLPSGRIY